jgi:threonine/homoserine/homoserine lactone efflux protein
MDPNFFIQALIIGFSVAAPVGPIGILCIEKTLAEGRSSGLATGLGAATADSVYGSIAAFGITTVSGLLVAQKYWLAIIGGLVLFYIGFRVFRSKPKDRQRLEGKGGILHNYVTTFGLTITNPMTIISFAAFYASFGVNGASRDYLSATIFVLGIFLGSSIWWVTLSSIVATFRARITPNILNIINKAAGLVIIGFGAFVLLKAMANS